MTKIDKLRQKLIKITPNSGCLTQNEAHFCGICHYGEWNEEQKEKIFSKMQKKKYVAFMSAKKQFDLYYKDENFISEIKSNLCKYTPNSGCLSKEEASFCGLVHRGEWNVKIFEKYMTTMPILNRNKFLEAKKNFALALYSNNITYNFDN